MRPTSIRLLLVDDEAIVREGLRMRLTLAPDMSVVGEAGSGLEAVEKAAMLDPEVVILDVHMAGMDGGEACSLIRTPTRAVVMLSIDDSEDLRARCAAAGAAAFVSKQDPAETLLAAIRRAAGPTNA